MPHSYRAICIALGFTFLLCQQPAWSQIAREGKTTYSNFDIRDPELTGNAKSNFRDPNERSRVTKRDHEYGQCNERGEGCAWPRACRRCNWK